MTAEQPDLGDDFLDRLRAFEQRARESVARIESLQATIVEQAAIPAPHATSATVDADGALTRLEIDDARRKELPDGALGHDITLGLAQALRDMPARPVAVDAADIAAAFASLAGSSDRAVEPRAWWNDTHTVGITLASGAVVGIECDSAWLDRTSSGVIAAEIMSSAALARAEEA